MKIEQKEAMVPKDTAQLLCSVKVRVSTAYLKSHLITVLKVK